MKKVMHFIFCFTIPFYFIFYMLNKTKRQKEEINRLKKSKKTEGNN